MLENKRFVQGHGWERFGELATKLDISRISVRGRYGVFCSAPTDTYILKDYAETGTWAPATNDFIRSRFPNGAGTYFDIGANNGLTVIPLAKETNVRCVAFEPDPTNYANLVANIAIHGASNIEAKPIALFDKNTKIAFEIAESNLGDHRISLPSSTKALVGEDRRRKIEVEAARLDDLQIDLTHPFFAKIDTQGAEPFIVSGGHQILSQADTILMEWSPYMMNRMSADPMIVIDFLRANFHVGLLNPDPIATKFSSEFTSIDRICDELRASLNQFTGMEYCDLIVQK
jgi:FkbM family methyltransferase